MSIHLSFNNIRNSKAVSEHVHRAFEELIKITDDKYPFHIKLNKVAESLIMWASIVVIKASNFLAKPTMRIFTRLFPKELIP